MFPIPWNKMYRKKDGTLTKIGDVIASGGGGSSVDGVYVGEDEPDEDLGEDGNYYLQIDVSGNIPLVTNTFKKINDNWVNSLIRYNIKTHSTGGSDASLDITQIMFDEIVFTRNISYQMANYSDDYIILRYSNAWVLTPNTIMYDDDGNVVAQTSWGYNTSKDITWYNYNPIE